jgi:hypothetical protein
MHAHWIRLCLIVVGLGMIGAGRSGHADLGLALIAIAAIWLVYNGHKSERRRTEQAQDDTDDAVQSHNRKQRVNRTSKSGASKRNKRPNELEAGPLLPLIAYREVKARKGIKK